MQSGPRRAECSYRRSSLALAGILVSREAWNDEEAIAHCRSDRRERGRRYARHTNIGTQRSASGAYASRVGDRGGVHLGEHFHVRENRAELFRQCVRARRVDAKARELSDVEHILTCDRHYSWPRSRVVYASLMVFLPTFSSSKSITAFTSRPTPESSAMDPSPNSLCFTRSPFTYRGSSCESSASVIATFRQDGTS